MDTPIHPSLKSKWVLLRVLTFAGMIALVAAPAGVALLAWPTVRTGDPNMSGYLIAGVSSLAVVMLCWLLKALRSWFESEKERILRASRLLDLGSPKSCLISFPTATANKRGVAQLARLRETGPSASKGSLWLAFGSLTTTTPKADEEVLVYLDADPIEPLVVVKSEKTLVIGFPVTPESLPEMMMRKKRLMTGVVAVTSLLMMAGMTGVTFMQREAVDKELRLAQSSLEWPMVTGRIQESRVEETTVTRGKREVRAFEAKVAYRYNVGGREYEGQRLYFSYFPEEDSGPARQLVDRYPSGAQVQVHYHPDQPHLSVLEPGHTEPLEEEARARQRVSYVLMVTFPLVSLLMCVVLNLTVNSSIRKTMELMTE